VRALWVLLVAVFVSSCVISGGPNCAEACDKAVACPNLDKDWLLACSPLVQQCSGDYGACAACILARDCSELASGACDDPCRSFGGPARLDLDQARKSPDPRLTRPRAP